MSEEEEEDEQPQSDLIPISSHRKVTDADEEIFILYTCSPPEIGQSGLGYVNNSHDLLEITIDLDSRSISPPTIKTLDHQDFQDSLQSRTTTVASKKKGRSGNTLKNSKASTSRKNVNLNGRAGVKSKQNEIKVILHQDASLSCFWSLSTSLIVKRADSNCSFLPFLNSLQVYDQSQETQDPSCGEVGETFQPSFSLIRALS